MFGLFALLQDGDERVSIVLGKQELVMGLVAFIGVEEVVVTDFLAGNRAVLPGSLDFQRLAQSGQQQQQRGQALLPIDDEHLRDRTDMINIFAYVDDGAKKMGGNLVVFRDPENIIPEVLAIADAPAIGALIDGNKKLFGALQKF